jgi:hypothetical protein
MLHICCIVPGIKLYKVLGLFINPILLIAPFRFVQLSNAKVTTVKLFLGLIFVEIARKFPSAAIYTCT